MIGKREILDLSGTLRLNPHIVEKGHALGWLLAGINAYPELIAVIASIGSRGRGIAVPQTLVYRTFV